MSGSSGGGAVYSGVSSSSSQLTDSVTVFSLERDIAALEQALTSSQGVYAETNDIDTAFLLLCTIFIFTFQLGLAFVEVGAVSPKNTKSVLIKNLLDCMIAAIWWWICGYAFAFGKDVGGLIGTTKFFVGNDMYANAESGYTMAHVFWSWSFTATSSTIVSGSVAERCSITAYMLYSIAIAAFIYPVTAHWIWDSEGWATRLRSDALFGCGALDMSGTCPVHFVGGFLALQAAIHTGPRRDRFTVLPNGEYMKMIGQSPALNTLGTLFLWTGWLAFNGSGAGFLVNNAFSVANAMVNTTISASAGCLAAVMYGEFYLNRCDTFIVNNCTLIALVSVTGCCAVVKAEAAFIIGLIASFLYVWGANMLIKMRVDDVVDASVVHGLGGVWGTIATGLFVSPEAYGFAISEDAELKNRCCGLFYGCKGQQMAANLTFLAACALWTFSTGFITFVVLKRLVGLRAEEEEDKLTGWTHHNNHHHHLHAAMNESRQQARVRYMMTLSRPKRHVGNPLHNNSEHSIATALNDSSGGGGSFVVEGGGGGGFDGGGSNPAAATAFLNHHSHHGVIGRQRASIGAPSQPQLSSNKSDGGGVSAAARNSRRTTMMTGFMRSLSPTANHAHTQHTQHASTVTAGRPNGGGGAGLRAKSVTPTPSAGRKQYIK